MVSKFKALVKSKMLRWRKNIDVDVFSEINFGVITEGGSRKYPSRVVRSRCDIYSIREGCHISDSVLQGNISLGRFVSIMGPGVVIKCLGDKMSIGSFSSIGQNVCIYDFNHNFSRPSSMLYNYIIHGGDHRADLSKLRTVEIQEDVWIGSNSVILSGVTIGRGAIIGAGSVVTKSIPPYSVACGNPAKIISARFADEVINRLERAKWWEFDIKKIIEEREFFLSDLRR
jgi:virginiamycin A acetyltransferase